MPSIRLCLFFISLFCGAAIIVALIMQHGFAMEPCPLCISQRIFILLVGSLTLLAAWLIQHRWLLRLKIVLAALSSLIGAAISARHVWIQNLPEDKVPECGMSFSYIFDTQPLFDALSLLFRGDGHCAEVHLSILGLSIPAWTLLSFIIMFVALSLLFWRSLKEK